MIVPEGAQGSGKHTPGGGRGRQEFRWKGRWLDWVGSPRLRWPYPGTGGSLRLVCPICVSVSLHGDGMTNGSVQPANPGPVPWCGTLPSGSFTLFPGLSVGQTHLPRQLAEAETPKGPSWEGGSFVFRLSLSLNIKVILYVSCQNKLENLEGQQTSTKHHSHPIRLSKPYQYVGGTVPWGFSVHVLTSWDQAVPEILCLPLFI